MMYDHGLISAKEARPKERAAANRALELDDTSAEAHMALGAILQYRDWNWAEAEREFRRAIQLNPNLALAHATLSEGLAARGRFEEAVAEIRRGRQLGPFDVTLNYGTVEILVYARHYDQAIEQGRKANELFPHCCDGIIRLAYEQKGDSQHAISPVLELVKVSKDWPTRPVLLADLAHAYSVFGNKQEASRLLAELTELSKRKDVSPWEFAIVYTGMGDKDRAFEWLDKAYDQRSPEVAWIKAEPENGPFTLRSALQGTAAALGFARVNCHRPVEFGYPVRDTTRPFRPGQERSQCGTRTVACRSRRKPRSRKKLPRLADPEMLAASCSAPALVPARRAIPGRRRIPHPKTHYAGSGAVQKPSDIAPRVAASVRASLR